MCSSILWNLYLVKKKCLQDIPPTKEVKKSTHWEMFVGWWSLTIRLDFYPREKAQERLDLVSANGITNKPHGFVSNHFQKLLRVKDGEIAGVQLPPPSQELGVRSPVLHAVLVLLYRPASRVGVVWSFFIRYPFPVKEITPLLIISDPCPWCWCGDWWWRIMIS